MSVQRRRHPEPLGHPGLGLVTHSRQHLSDRERPLHRCIPLAIQWQRYIPADRQRHFGFSLSGRRRDLQLYSVHDRVGTHAQNRALLGRLVALWFHAHVDGDVPEVPLVPCVLRKGEDDGQLRAETLARNEVPRPQVRLDVVVHQESAWHTSSLFVAKRKWLMLRDILSVIQDGEYHQLEPAPRSPAHDRSLGRFALDDVEGVSVVQACNLNAGLHSFLLKNQAKLDACSEHGEDEPSLAHPSGILFPKVFVCTLDEHLFDVLDRRLDWYLNIKARQARNSQLNFNAALGVEQASAAFLPDYAGALAPVRSLDDLVARGQQALLAIREIFRTRRDDPRLQLHKLLLKAFVLENEGASDRALQQHLLQRLVVQQQHSNGQGGRAILARDAKEKRFATLPLHRVEKCLGCIQVRRTNSILVVQNRICTVVALDIREPVANPLLPILVQRQ
mmetsp:Transcript_30603/g.77306  ORF Transcript_30603/g.77306 Transcript_30603/m.77306 type:complete len:448 (-) Transcript_30603:21-1364(-)